MSTYTVSKLELYVDRSSDLKQKLFRPPLNISYIDVDVSFSHKTIWLKKATGNVDDTDFDLKIA